MRKAIVVVFLILFSANAARADLGGLLPWKHALPLSAGAIELMREAVERSSIVEDLLRQLEETGLMVYITDVMPGGVSGPASYLVYLSNEGGVRYVLIRVDRWRTRPYERIALLGHELQHALEVAAAPEVRDAGGLADLYRRIGWEGQPGKFETAAAQVTGSRIRSQLAKGDDGRRPVAAATGL